MGQRKSENADNKKQITDVTKQNKQREESSLVEFSSAFPLYESEDHNSENAEETEQIKMRQEVCGSVSPVGPNSTRWRRHDLPKSSVKGSSLQRHNE
ncbi:hypothetical protein T4C_3820 [Trichinella pseudospiralis]|uniref:Uncharacterized protein n=1 Tax=Trichinella pseudospiralis TaxID=6337 RepID=A0A0V1IMH1_TRIPS|nr:hypothetical protein T4C_3820 [Trichinella pseudospiralis]